MNGDFPFSSQYKSKGFLQQNTAKISVFAVFFIECILF